MLIRARAPLRLGFGGGGTDVSPFCDLHGGYILNATIDKYAYAVLRVLEEDTIRFVSTDQQLVLEYPLAPRLEPDGRLDLHKGVYNRMIRDFRDGIPMGVELTTFVDAPPGSGLGTSSTLVVAMVKAFMELLNLPLGDYEAAHLAYEIERRDLTLSGGRQDQYAATFGGFNFMEFYDNDRVIVNPLRIKNWILCELEASLVLFFTGVSRESAKIIDEQARNVYANAPSAVEAMHQLKRDAVKMKESLLRGQLADFASHLEESWLAKKRTAANVSTPLIESVYEGARRAGALAGKVSGAGGGGFIMFIVDPVRRMDVMRFLKGQNGDVSTCHFTKAGMQAWRID